MPVDQLLVSILLMHLVRVDEPLSLIDNYIRLIYIVPKVIEVESVLHKVKVKRYWWVACFNLWLPAELHIGYQTLLASDERHCLFVFVDAHDGGHRTIFYKIIEAYNEYIQ
jgi:tRNA isopentenyl-2-thiomethyl-A-37 hydroxylase MiaE